MASNMALSRIEQENTLLFGLKWSVVGCAVAISFLGGCSALFDQRVPRYNMVQGPRHVPLYNQDYITAAPASAVGAEAAAAMPPVAMPQQDILAADQPPAPMMAPAAPPLAPAAEMPPVTTPDNSAAFVQNVPPSPATPMASPSMEEETPWYDVTSWFNNEEPAMAEMPRPISRKVPLENLDTLPEMAAPAQSFAPATAPMTAMNNMPDVAFPPLDTSEPVLPPSNMPMPAMPLQARVNEDIARLNGDLADAQNQQQSLQNQPLPLFNAEDNALNNLPPAVALTTPPAQPGNGYKVIQLPSDAPASGAQSALANAPIPAQPEHSALSKPTLTPTIIPPAPAGTNTGTAEMNSAYIAPNAAQPPVITPADMAAMPQGYAAPMASNAPMPPVITDPAPLPVYEPAPAPSSLDVPLPPEVQPAYNSGMAMTLTPPPSLAREGYLPQSRYTRR